MKTYCRSSLDFTEPRHIGARRRTVIRTYLRLPLCGNHCSESFCKIQPLPPVIFILYFWGSTDGMFFQKFFYSSRLLITRHCWEKVCKSKPQSPQNFIFSVIWKENAVIPLTQEKGKVFEKPEASLLHAVCAPSKVQYKNYGRERLDFTERLRTVIAAKRQP